MNVFIDWTCGSFWSIQSDFSFFSQLPEGFSLKVGTVNSRFPESAGVFVFFPVVVPVPIDVGAVAEHGHLPQGDKAGMVCGELNVPSVRRHRMKSGKVIIYSELLL